MKSKSLPATRTLHRVAASMDIDARTAAPADSALASRLRRIAAGHARPALASSLGAEDMVLLDAIAAADLPIGVFVIDTGRLHDETLQLLETARARYGAPSRCFDRRPRPSRPMCATTA